MQISRHYPFTVRMPGGMRSRIRKSALKNKRSMNSEIVFHLDQVLPDKAAQKKGPVEGATSPSHELDPTDKGKINEQS